MVSFWDHMKSVLKTIKKKNPTLALVSGGTPARSPALSATSWLSSTGWHRSPPWRHYYEAGEAKFSALWLCLLSPAIFLLLSVSAGKSWGSPIWGSGGLIMLFWCRITLNHAACSYSVVLKMVVMEIRVWRGQSPCSPKDSQDVFPAPQFKRINSLALSLLYGQTLTSIHDYWKKHSLDYMDLCWPNDVSTF